MSWLSLTTVAVLLFLCPCEDVEAEVVLSGEKDDPVPPAIAKAVASVHEKSSDKKVKSIPTEKKVNQDTEVTNKNETAAHDSPVDRPVVQRALYVLVGITGLVVTYFVIRTISIRRKARKTKRYGILSPSERMELAPLDAGDDDEDESTLFEARQLHR